MVHAQDPISRAGVVSQLREHAVIDLVEDNTAPPGVVAVVVAETLDDATAAGLRKLVRGDGARPVLVVSLLRGNELLKAIECGVGAVVWRREATAHQLVHAVLDASRGDGNLPADLLGRLMNQVGTMHRGAASHPGLVPSGLGPREVDVLRLIAEGLDTVEIASKLSYSERTVKGILHNLTTRLHLRNRSHAVAYALREGYI